MNNKYYIDPITGQRTYVHYKKISQYDEYWEIRMFRHSKVPKINHDDIIDMHFKLEGARI